MTNQPVDEEKSVEITQSPWVKIGIFFSTFAIIISVFAFGYGYFELAKVNMALAKMVTDLQTQTNKNEKTILSLQDNLQTVQQTLQKTQSLPLEQEKLLSDWRTTQKNELEKWQVAEAQYLIKLANDHLQFTHNHTLVLTLLQNADQLLQPLQNANLLDIRKAIAADIASLQAAPAVDITSLYVRLSGLNSQIDQLPLPANPLKPDEKTENPVVPADLPWWKTGLVYSWQALKKIVVVRDLNQQAMPLVLPEEKIFLYQNLHAQMESAMWGVLHRNDAVYQASLTRLTTWIKAYFDQEAALTKNMLQHISELQKINPEPKAATLSTTLQLFDNYFAQANTAS